MSFFSGLFGNYIAIDLGTANTLVWVRGRGIVVNEPTVVVVNSSQYTQPNRVRAITDIGIDAAPKVNACPTGMKAIWPLQDGVIADFDLVECMLRHFISKAKCRRLLSRPKVVVAVPCQVNLVEERAVVESALAAGASEVYLVKEPVASAVGAGVAVDEAAGNMIVDIGGGTTEVAVISLSGIVVAESAKVGGKHMDRAIINYIRKKYNLLIGESTAEDIKIKIGSALELDEPLAYEARGRDLVDGYPKTLYLTHDEVREALSGCLDQITEAIRNVLENAPPDLAGDIISRGIILAGGGALLKRLDEYIHMSTRLPVTIADDPLTCVARGAGEMVEDWSLLQRVNQLA